MKHFIDNLERELVAAADAEATRGPLNRAARTVTSAGSRQVVGLAAAFAIVAFAIVAFGSQVNGTPAQASLRVLALPTADATSTQARDPTLRNIAGDFSRARTFNSPNGAGYVTTSRDGKQLCISIPDIDGYGTACRPTTEVRTQGLSVALIATEGPRGPNTPKNSQFAGVLPAGVDEATLQYAGQPARNHSYPNGIIVVDAKRDVTLRWRTANGTRSFTIRAREPAQRVVFDCGRDIGTRELPPGADPKEICAE